MTVLYGNGKDRSTLTMKPQSPSLLKSKWSRLTRLTSKSKLHRKYSFWDLLATEIKHLILLQCDILTRFLNGLLTESEVNSTHHKFGTVPSTSGFPTINNGLDKVNSRSFYLRLCEYRPDLAGIEKLQAFFENESLWSWTDDTFNSIRSFDNWFQVISNMDNLLIHIPIRQMWSDQLRQCLKFDKMKLLIFVGCKGHLQLFKTFLKDVLKLRRRLRRVLNVACNKILKVAAESGHLGIVEELLGNDFGNELEGGAALYAASKQGHLAVVKVLLLSRSERTDLLPGFVDASSHGHADVVTYYHGFHGTGRFNAAGWNNQAFILACNNGHHQVVRILVQVNGIDPSARQNEPFKMACANGHTEVVKLLLETGAVDATADNNYAIRYAAANGHVSVVRLLLQVANVNVSANENEAFRYACIKGTAEVVNLLLKTGRVVKLLLKLPDVDVTVFKNRPLQYTVRNWRVEVVKVLLEIEIVRARSKSIKRMLRDISNNAVAKGRAELMQLL
ncbi:hypothetical protein HDU76_010790 [Blyttiomyces sp. JEL0837]|nr:hypothetical protein HDU76_010790 [Blyttiomyces sp. JEL0837]